MYSFEAGIKNASITYYCNIKLTNTINGKFQKRSGIHKSHKNQTAVYSALLNSKGECVFGMGDMNIFQDITPVLIMDQEKVLKKSPLVIIDGNIPVNTMEFVLNFCNKNSVPGEKIQWKQFISSFFE